jgi:hypothetical protein
LTKLETGRYRGTLAFMHCSQNRCNSSKGGISAKAPISQTGMSRPLERGTIAAGTPSWRTPQRPQ